MTTTRRKIKIRKKKRQSKRKTGLTLTGKLRRGYRYAKGGRVVKAKKEMNFKKR